MATTSSPPVAWLNAPTLRARRRVLTESVDLAVGTKAPDFALPEPLTGGTVTLADVSAGKKATLVCFICNHCPYVVLLKGAFRGRAVPGGMLLLCMAVSGRLAEVCLLGKRHPPPYACHPGPPLALYPQKTPSRRWPRTTRPAAWVSWQSAATASRRTPRTGPTPWPGMRASWVRRSAVLPVRSSWLRLAR